jgi:hypothetical protein
MRLLGREEAENGARRAPEASRADSSGLRNGHQTHQNHRQRRGAWEVVAAWLGTGTGIWWLKDGFPASPATAGVAAMPPVATMAARISSKRFI